MNLHIQVIEDCSSKDPSLPDDVDKKDLEGYVRGPLVFIEDDPGLKDFQKCRIFVTKHS